MTPQHVTSPARKKAQANNIVFSGFFALSAAKQTTVWELIGKYSFVAPNNISLINGS
jgi:hypothetical protein